MPTPVWRERRDDKISVVEFLWDAYRLGSGIAPFETKKKGDKECWQYMGRMYVGQRQF